MSRASPAITVQASVVGCVGLAREALVVVGPEERLEPGRLGPLHDGQLLVVGEAHLGLGHQREPHVLDSSAWR